MFYFVPHYFHDLTLIKAIRSCFTCQKVHVHVLLCTFSFMPESPRWLYLHGRQEEADIIIQKAAKCNAIQLEEDINVTVKVVALLVHSIIYYMCSI